MLVSQDTCAIKFIQAKDNNNLIILYNRLALILTMFTT